LTKWETKKVKRVFFVDMFEFIIIVQWLLILWQKNYSKGLKGKRIYNFSSILKETKFELGMT